MSDNAIRVERGQRADAYLLGDPARTTLPVAYENSTVIIKGPAEAPDPVNTVLVLATQG